MYKTIQDIENDLHLTHIDTIKTSGKFLRYINWSILVAVIIFTQMPNVTDFNYRPGTLDVILFATLITFHELSHYIVIRIYGYKAKLKLFSVEIESAIKREHLLVFLISPMAILSVVYLIILLIFPSLTMTAFILIVANYYGSRSDIEQFITVRKAKKNTVIGRLNDGEILVFAKRTIKNSI
ncbi:DUF3267 domain-containing protein [Fictibacillus nanhaiensis]|uniref:DUF3267 domain-containing protein n=1 Tax=Fictibacillus nanhaiensis TaxID=742169 RepID=UPI002E23C268|nr:DUF3267 domain-containing protein [Fictibacillus nanhaiensis]